MTPGLIDLVKVSKSKHKALPKGLSLDPKTNLIGQGLIATNIEQFITLTTMNQEKILGLSIFSKKYDSHLFH